MLATAIIIKCGCWDALALGMVSGMQVVAEKAFQCRWLMTDNAYHRFIASAYSSSGSPTAAKVEYIHSWAGRVYILKDNHG